jgi:hypothetical protein
MDDPGEWIEIEFGNVHKDGNLKDKTEVCERRTAGISSGNVEENKYGVLQAGSGQHGIEHRSGGNDCFAAFLTTLRREVYLR